MLFVVVTIQYLRKELRTLKTLTLMNNINNYSQLYHILLINMKEEYISQEYGLRGRLC